MTNTGVVVVVSYEQRPSHQLIRRQTYSTNADVGPHSIRELDHNRRVAKFSIAHEWVVHIHGQGNIEHWRTMAEVETATYGKTDDEEEQKESVLNKRKQ